MSLVFQGDPRLFLDKNGAYIAFSGGQPVMDRGFENVVLILLFTRKGWVGNSLFKDPQKYIGSDFEKAHDAPFTSQSFARIENAAQVALQVLLDTGVASAVEIVSQTLDGFAVTTTVRVTSPNLPFLELIVTKNGPNWVFQKTDPAYLREPKPAVGKGEIIYYHPANVVCGATSGLLQVSPQGETFGTQNNPIPGLSLATGVYGSRDDMHLLASDLGSVITGNGVNPWSVEVLPNEIASALWTGAAYAPQRDLYVLVATTNAGSERMGLFQGGEWAGISPPTSTFYKDVINLQNVDRLISVADTAIAQPLAVSDDGGQTWVMKNSPNASNIWWTMAYSEADSRVVMFARTGTNRLAVSDTSGDSWTTYTLPTTNVMRGTARSDELGLYVAVGSGASAPRFLYSVDGVTWSAADSEPTDVNVWNRVRWSPTLQAFIATASSGTANRNAKSIDGKNWVVYQSVSSVNYAALSVR
jgi:phage gp46-like protein